MQRVAKQLGYGVESVRSWVRDRDVADGLAGPDAQRVRELEQRAREARAGEQGVAAHQLDLEDRVSFLRGGARPPIEVIVDYIDEHRDEFGVEPICRVLQIAPSTYYAAKKRRSAPSARAVRDAVMIQVLMVLWIANRKVYGAHKLWKAARRAGHDVGRDQVARLMRVMEIEGISRQRRKMFTTRQDPDAVRAPDLVNRNFRADRPDALWVTDLERHEAFLNLAVVKGHRHQFVAADWLKLRAA